LASVEMALSSASSPEAKGRADDTKAKTIARIAELETRWAAAKAELQPKLDSAASAREAAVAAEAVRVPAAEAARAAARELKPISVFISRKTQRLYVRRGFEPVMESPVTIIDADRPIGTHVFTAMERNGDTDMRWSVVTLEGGSDAGVAKTALDRIVIPQDVLERIAGLASPRSSLIISDEGLSSETRKGTDFIVVLSGEPQGSLKMRRRAPAQARLPWRRGPSWARYSIW